MWKMTAVLTACLPPTRGRARRGLRALSQTLDQLEGGRTSWLTPDTPTRLDACLRVGSGFTTRPWVETRGATPSSASGRCRALTRRPTRALRGSLHAFQPDDPTANWLSLLRV